MIHFFSQQCKEKRLAGGFLTATIRLDGHKNGIDLGKLLRIVGAQDPAPVGSTVFVKNSQIERPPFVAGFTAPDLEGARSCILDSWFPIQVEGIKNQGPALRVEHPAKWLPSLAAAVNIEDISNVKLAGAHQLADIAVRHEVLI